ncbi:uncharacterized protein LDX57_001135 [Aspergillus melleus]|uniref:uncharacterized protein n=1 Tax=Aspergillus melleus TaxID=138277 RepID=UPI001E8D01FA|nr:uncharacterized protein LDX57_001135 [Aspergillus melleus]KAH8423377.1 hypothetical protein LDX57_001135 [Aspergillus melleus]
MSTTAPASSQRPGFVAISTATGRSMDYTDFAFRTLHPPDVLIQIEEDLDNEDDPHYHPTYIDLATSIYDKAVAIDSMFDQQNVHFSAQDDDWESHWRKRVGTPLTRFRDQWLSLREIPPSGVQSHGSDPLAAGRRTGSLKKDLTRLGKTYFNSHPGPDNLASNIALHGDLNSVFNKYIEKREHTDDELMVLFNKVIWRLNLMADADEYILAMGLKFAKCSEYILPINRHMHSDKDKLQKRAEENKATQLLPSIQAYKVVNDDVIRSKLVTCFRALRGVGHKLHVKAHAIKHKMSDAATASVEDIPTF